MRMMLFMNNMRATNLPDLNLPESQSKCRCQCLQSLDFQHRFNCTVALTELRSAVAAFHMTFADCDGPSYTL